MFAYIGSFTTAKRKARGKGISVYHVDAIDGTLSAIGWEPAQGTTPRFFTLDPQARHLYVANETSDTIVAFRLDARSGLPMPNGQVIRSGSPSCIAFATALHR